MMARVPGSTNCKWMPGGLGPVTSRAGTVTVAPGRRGTGQRSHDGPRTGPPPGPAQDSAGRGSQSSESSLMMIVTVSMAPRQSS